MDFLNCLIGLSVFQRLSNLSTSHVELSSVILIEITGQGAKGAFGGEGERSSCRRLNCYQFGIGWFAFNIVRLERGCKKVRISTVSKLTAVQ